jgi:cytochrome c oxidase assembly factor CtaG
VLDNLPDVLVIAAFALHVLGERRTVVLTGRPRSPRARARALCFYAGLLTVLVALASPLDALADKLFWVHMIQHLMLLVVAAPLIVIGRPWMSIWRPLPLDLRRAVARTMYRSGWTAPLRWVSARLTGPLGAWLAFTVTMVGWHLPALYDLTLRNTAVHIAEHSLFLATGILFWAQVIGAAPARSVLPYLKRIAYVGAAIIPNVGLSMVLGFGGHALYAPYIHLLQRPGGISALADQQIGAGIMWAAGDIPYVLAIVWLAQRWLAQGEAQTARVDALVAARLRGEPAGPA